MKILPTTCVKLYSEIPFAHRQPSHAGHCRFIHGHGWSFEIEFGCESKDECGFVVDFGGLKGLKKILDDKFDHALVLNADDPLVNVPALDAVLEVTGRNLVLVPDCSAEGLAEHVLLLARTYVESMTVGRVTVVRVTCYEDSRNSAIAFNHDVEASK